ncbi:MAG: hypothetical protein KAI71_05790 [Candidatus Pacebacteria bacterium]|nr:hypothetical protein [Candidatus Paceibacterota bacterium]
MKKIAKIIRISLIAVILITTVSNVCFANLLFEKDNDARTEYKSARQLYLNEVDAYKTARANFLLIKEKYRKFGGIENKEGYKDKAHKFLNRSVSASIKYLEVMQNKAKNVRGISEEDRELILADIDVNIDYLEERQDKLSGDLSTTEIKQEAILIKDHWKNVKLTFKKAIGEILIARTSFVVEKFENYSEKINLKIQDLDDKDYNTSELKICLKELNQNIASAKDEIETAKDRKDNLTNENLNQITKEIRRSLKDTHSYIRKAHLNLIDIIKKMNELEIQ